MNRDARQERPKWVAELYASDPQFAAAKPDPSVTAAAGAPGLRLPAIVKTVLQGYANRPALASRATTLVTDRETGRKTVNVLPRFQTQTYGQLWDQVEAVAVVLQDAPVRPGDRVAIRLAHADYAIIDIALTQLMNQCASADQCASRLQPIVAETEPTLIASSGCRAFLDDVAVELSPAIGRSGSWCST